MSPAANILNAIKVEIKTSTEKFHPDLALKIRAAIQRAICWTLLLPFGGVLVVFLKYFRRYEVEDMAVIRRQFRDIWSRNKGPLIICANHLTFIDSALIMWALASNFWYWRNYQAFAWNLPAGDVFKKKLRHHLTLYLTKCVFLHRDGSAQHKYAVLYLCRYLLLKGDVVLIFPEGQRSRSGHFDEKTLRFGVGKIVSSLDDCRVLCIYLRADIQETFSDYPSAGARFKLKLQLLVPAVSTTSRKQASVEIVRQIGAVIKQLEDEYFDERKIAKRN